MKLYQVSMDTEEGRFVAEWTDSKARIPAVKRKLVERGGDKKNCLIATAEFQTNKAGILELLNTFAARG